MLHKHQQHGGVGFVPPLCTGSPEMKMAWWPCQAGAEQPVLLLASGMVAFRLLSHVLIGGYEENYAKTGNAAMSGQITVVGGRFWVHPQSWCGQHPSHRSARRASLWKGGKSSEMKPMIWAKSEI